MSKVKIEAFFSASASSGDIDLSELLKEIKEEFGDKVEIAVYKGQNELFDEYGLTLAPAVVVGEIIKIVGVCPSKETLVSALREAGLE